MTAHSGTTARARARAVRFLRDARAQLTDVALAAGAPRPHPSTVFRHAAAGAAWEAAAWLHGPDGMDRAMSRRFAEESAAAWRLLVDRADACDPWAVVTRTPVPRGTAEWVRRVVDDALADIPEGGER